MKYLSFFLMLPFFTQAYECPTENTLHMQRPINERFIDRYKSHYAYAHIFCRQRNCLRATLIYTTPTGGAPDTGREEREITSITCTDSPTDGFWRRKRHPIITSILRANYTILSEKASERGGLPDLRDPNIRTADGGQQVPSTDTANKGIN